ncbi:TonB-dependent receptor [Novosphingobium sp. BL-8H]|uniref:TonB-dependent receptor n=1 Tax=Novosphingobium sp. BL-8H TaxID=3127640 RepID=UPI0037574530
MASREWVFAVAFLGSIIPAGAMAQDEGSQEVVVTATRREADDYAAEMPAVGLRRKADFAVVAVTVSGDSRDKAQRESEIYDMIRAAIAAAPRSGVQLAYGERTLQPLTPQNYRELSLSNDSRPDSQRTSFLVKVPLAGSMDAQGAQAAITGYVKSVKPVGRALLTESNDLSLSVVAPDQYRGQIADAIATDAKAMAARLGDGYGVEIEGLNRPVEWARSGLSEVLLYMPYKLTVVPKR